MTSDHHKFALTAKEGDVVALLCLTRPIYMPKIGIACKFISHLIVMG